MEGTLSRDVRLLALCARPGEMTGLDVSSGTPRQVLRGDFAMVHRMDFLPDGRRLLVAEVYGRWSLRCLDIGTGQPDPDWTELQIDGGAVALSPAGDRVALARRDRISIHDLGQGGQMGGFALEHVVKRCAMTWIADDALAVRTDLGCTSIYAVP